MASLHDILHLLKISSFNHTLYINININKFILRVLILLKKLHFIYDLIISLNKYNYFVTVCKPSIMVIKSISTKSCHYYWSWKQCNIKVPGFFILTTKKGLLTHIEAYKKKEGGKVLFYIQ